MNAFSNMESFCGANAYLRIFILVINLAYISVNLVCAYVKFYWGDVQSCSLCYFL